MKIMQIILGVWLLFFKSSALASNSSFCIQSKQGLNCNYRTQEACDADAKDKEFCVPNPREDSTHSELQEPQAMSPYCKGTFVGKVCLQFPQEPCNEEERRIDQDLRCEPN